MTDIRIRFEGYINSLIDAREAFTEDKWTEIIRKDADDMGEDISDADIKGIIEVLEDEGLLIDLHTQKVWFSYDNKGNIGVHDAAYEEAEADAEANAEKYPDDDWTFGAQD